MGKYPKPTIHSSCLIHTLKQSSLLGNMSPEFTLVRCPCYRSQAHLGNPVFRESRETQGVSFSAYYPYWRRERKLVRTLILGATGCSALFSWPDPLWSLWQGSFILWRIFLHVMLSPPLPDSLPRICHGSLTILNSRLTFSSEKFCFGVCLWQMAVWSKVGVWVFSQLLIK